jgi:CheY-like chemotaxis protein
LLKILNQIGNYQVEVVQEAKVGIELFSMAVDRSCKCIDRAFKLVLMDIQMPEINGYEASELIMELAKDKVEVNIVAITSYVNRDVETKCTEAGVKAIYKKPLTIT